MSDETVVPDSAKGRSRMPTGSVAVLDYDALFRKVEQVLEKVESADPEVPIVQKLVEGLTVSLGDELGILGGRLYARTDDGTGYIIWSSFGRAQPVERGHSVPATYPPIVSCLEQGVLYSRSDNPELDRSFEDSIGAEYFAAAEVGNGDFIIAVDLPQDHRRDDILFTLGLLRNGINDRIRIERMEGVLHQARQIQASILPLQAPDFPPFDIYGRNEMLESVGGDFYDCIPLTKKILGVAIADVAGHGLPAALQVRDIHMGLRMGTAADFKIVRTVERLNQIIHQSRLTSRFVSMFYGELETDGTLIYVNAGHHPPLFVKRSGEVRYLTEGGSILGPIPDAQYNRGYLTMEPGDIVVAFTDGLLEWARGTGDDREEFGNERMERVIVENRHRAAHEIGHAIFEAAEAFAEGTPPTDDRTVAVISRRAQRAE